MTNAQARGKPRPVFFSIVMSPHHQLRTLRAGLETVYGQDFQDYELLVLDDGNLGGLQGLLAREFPRSRTLRVPAEKLRSAQLNLGIKSALGRYVVFLDPDDVWHPRYLSYQYAAFEALPDALFVQATCYSRRSQKMIGTSRELQAVQVPDPALVTFVQATLQTRSCIAAARSLLIRHGGFDERLARFANIDLQFRLLAGFGPEILAYEEHPAPQIPQILVMTGADDTREANNGDMEQWIRDLGTFCDFLFERQVFRRFRAHRVWFENAMIEKHALLLRPADAMLEG